jgi:hypothetical protein
MNEESYDQTKSIASPDNAPRLSREDVIARFLISLGQRFIMVDGGQGLTVGRLDVKLDFRYELREVPDQQIKRSAHWQLFGFRP